MPAAVCEGLGIGVGQSAGAARSVPLGDCAVPTACMELSVWDSDPRWGSAFSAFWLVDCAVLAACMELGMGLGDLAGAARSVPFGRLRGACGMYGTRYGTRQLAGAARSVPFGRLRGAYSMYGIRYGTRTSGRGTACHCLTADYAVPLAECRELDVGPGSVKGWILSSVEPPRCPRSPRIRELALGWDIVGFPNFVDLLRVERSRNNNPTLSFHTFGSCMARWAGDRAVGVLIRNVEAHEWYLISVGWQACCCRKRIVAPQALCMGSAGIFHCLWASLWVPVLNTVRMEFRYFRWVSFSSRVPTGARGGACFHAGVPCVRTFGAAKGRGSWLCSRMRIVGRAEWESP